MALEPGLRWLTTAPKPRRNRMSLRVSGWARCPMLRDEQAVRRLITDMPFHVCKTKDTFQMELTTSDETTSFQTLSVDVGMRRTGSISAACCVTHCTWTAAPRQTDRPLGTCPVTQVTSTWRLYLDSRKLRTGSITGSSSCGVAYDETYGGVRDRLRRGCRRHSSGASRTRRSWRRRISAFAWFGHW
jgi:hypothetical protein